MKDLELQSPTLGTGRTHRPVGLALMLLATFIVGTMSWRSFATEQAPPNQLQEYLRLLRYEPVSFRKNERNLPLVEGELGTGKKCLFLVDSGWGMTTVDPRSAVGCKTLGELGVTLKDSFWGRLTNSSLVLMDKLALGRAQFLNQPARVVDLNMDYVRVQNDAVLGCDFLLRNYCLIDCGARQLYVRGTKPSEEESKALCETLRRSGFVEIPVLWQLGLVVEAKVNGLPLHLVVDTGGFTSVIDDAQLTRLGLTTVKEDAPATGTFIPRDMGARVSGVGKIGTHGIRVTTLKNLQIGQKSWRSIHFGVVDLRAWGTAKPGGAEAEIEGLLGRDMLIGHGALIDFGNRRLWFRPEKEEKH